MIDINLDSKLELNHLKTTEIDLNLQWTVSLEIKEILLKNINRKYVYHIIWNTLV